MYSPTASLPALTAQLARLRVPLGFAAGLISVVIARPTATSVAVGTLVALSGEGIRVWAAGHLEKSREVTRSGPYRWVRHPLYVGSTVMGAGISLACASLWVALIAVVYLGTTLTAAVRTEEAFLRVRFGTQYDEYCGGCAGTVDRTFSWDRVWRNREWRAFIGLGAVVAMLAAKTAWLG